MMMRRIKKPGNWLNRTIQRMRSTGTARGSSASSPQSKQQASQSSPSLHQIHRSCKTISVEAFIQAYCNDDLSGLIISGEPSKEELKESWEGIYIDYCCRIKYPQSNLLLDLSKQIGIMDCHVLYVQNAVMYLRYRYDEEVITELRRLGYNITYGPDDEEQRTSQLNRTLSLLKTVIFDLEGLKDQYANLSRMSSSKQQTEEDFLSIMFSVAKYQGYAIDKKKTVVEDFIVMYNNFLAYLENLQKQNKHG